MSGAFQGIVLMEEDEEKEFLEEMGNTERWNKEAGVGRRGNRHTKVV